MTEHTSPARTWDTACKRCGAVAAMAAAAATLTLTGCAGAPPQPWEKGILAKPEMTMAGDALEQRYSQHVYTSKEAASGGYGVGGGGCGCN
jgi:hypothetical protein